MSVLSLVFRSWIIPRGICVSLMADNLVDQVSNLKITVDEGSVVDLGDLDVNPMESSTPTCIGGKSSNNS